MDSSGVFLCSVLSILYGVLMTETCLRQLNGGHNYYHTIFGHLIMNVGHRHDVQLLIN